MSFRSAVPLYLLILLAAVWLIGKTAELLPGQVAVYFTFSGSPAGSYARDRYIDIILLLTVALPLTLAAVMLIIPKHCPAVLYLPNSRFWFAPEQRRETLKYLALQGLYLGMTLTTCFVVIHCLIVWANSAEPPRMLMLYFFSAIMLVIVVVALWLVRVRRRFLLK